VLVGWRAWEVNHVHNSGAIAFADWSLLLLRLMLALVFGTSGYNHLRHPKERSASIGMSVPFTVFLARRSLPERWGCGGNHGAVGGAGLTFLMLGAIYKKVVEWKTGFWARSQWDGTTRCF